MKTLFDILEIVNFFAIIVPFALLAVLLATVLGFFIRHLIESFGK
jgi:hypothetical protein